MILRTYSKDGSSKLLSILYTGKLRDTGKLFESNLEGSPLKFRLGMRVGDKRRLIIPPSLGYILRGRIEEGKCA
ncbi:BnaC09g22340D [Brassica napus]|uniref:peptidylprolyl isomerase n=1 Tax=Brassica napus TaxID=3708 RepID=A0A078I4E2_BRANA|nr:BnaC09g22340D [Brassica napus]